MRGTDDVSLPLIGGRLRGGGGGRRGGGPTLFRSYFSRSLFQKVLSYLGTIFKFLSILGDNFFMCFL